METDLFGISDSPDTTKNAATEAAKATRKTAPKDQASPLAERLRPKTIDEVVGQTRFSTVFRGREDAFVPQLRQLF